MIIGMSEQTAIGAMHRSVRGMIKRRGESDLSRGYVEAINRSRTILADPAHVVAWSRAVDDVDVVAMTRLPFPRTLIDYGAPLPMGWNFVDDETGIDYGPVFSRGCVLADEWPYQDEGSDEVIYRRACLSHFKTHRLPDFMLPAPADNRWPDGVGADARYSFGVLLALECLHVELVEVGPYPRGHVAAGQPRFEVAVRTGRRRAYQSREDVSHVDYSHRFEVAGNFAHHYELTVNGRPNPHYQTALERYPHKLVEVVDGDGVKRSCFRVWRPSHVKGPDDKPLVPKLRVVRA